VFLYVVTEPNCKVICCACNKKQAGFIPRKVALLSHKSKCKGKVCIRAKWPIRSAFISGFCDMKRLEVFLLPLDGMPVHRRVTPSIKFAGTHLYTWVERGTVRVKCLADEHNTMSPARARTGPHDPKRSALTMRPLRLPLSHKA